MRAAAFVLLAGCDGLLGIDMISPPPAALVQQNTSWNESQPQLSVSLQAPPTSEDVLVLIGGAEAGTTMPPTGGGVTTWQTAASSTVDEGIQIWFGVTDGTSSTVSVANANHTLDVAWLALTEWSGLDTLNTLDGNIGSGMVTTASGTVDLQTTTHNAPELLVFAVACYGSIGEPGEPWSSLVPVTTASVRQQTWYRLATIAGIQTAETTYSTGWDSALATFRLKP